MVFNIRRGQMGVGQHSSQGVQPRRADVDEQFEQRVELSSSIKNQKIMHP